MATGSAKCSHPYMTAPLPWAHQDEGKGEDIHRKETNTQVACPARLVLRTEVLWS